MRRFRHLQPVAAATVDPVDAATVALGRAIAEGLPLGEAVGRALAAAGVDELGARVEQLEGELAELQDVRAQIRSAVAA